MTNSNIDKYRVAVLLPCFNEERSIEKVINDFRAALPNADIYVFDNNSSDRTAELARRAGAEVRCERWPGKGNVVRRMFSDVESDIYVMADGDGTYDAMVAPNMIDRLVVDQLDMVVGVRMNINKEAYRFGHALGNRFFNYLYGRLFGAVFTDIFSGYRVFSHRFAKSFPAVSSGFEIETEISVHAVQLRIPLAEVPTAYGSRQDGSSSKLRTIPDSLKILATFLLLYKEIKPASFFGIGAAALALVALALGAPLVLTYLETGLVPRFPTAILVSGILVLSMISLMSGLILDSVARSRQEQKRLWYLSLPSLEKNLGHDA